MTSKKTCPTAAKLHEHFRPSIDTVFLRDNALFVRTKQRFQKQMISDVLWVQADNIYVDIHAVHRVYKLSMSIKRFQEQVGNSDLVRVNRSQLVNVSKIDSFEPHRAFIGDLEFKITDNFRSCFYNSFQ